MTPDPEDLMAVSRNSENYSIKDILDQMTREGATITKAEALGLVRGNYTGYYQPGKTRTCSHDPAGKH